MSKSTIRFSRADGSTRRRVEEIVRGIGRFSPKRIAKRSQRFQHREARP